MVKARAFIALGANLGTRRRNLSGAIVHLGALPQTHVVGQSKIRSTRPVGGPKGQGRYLNGVVEICTALTPKKLMAQLLKIERAMGRDRAREVRFGPRVIDLDMLMYGDKVMKSRGLVLPHPRMHERRFVIDPMCDIAPDLMHPVKKKTMLELRGDSKRRDRQKIIRLNKRPKRAVKNKLAEKHDAGSR